MIGDIPRVRAGWTLERGAALQLVRAVEAVIVIAVPSFVPRAGVLVPMAITYLVIVGIGEVIRRSGLPARRAVWRGWLLLCIDGAFLVTAVVLSGGYKSPLVFCLFLHVMAISLLGGARAGVRFAGWSAALLIGGLVLQHEGVFHVRDFGTTRGVISDAVALGVVAAAVGLCCFVHEQPLRRSREQLAALVDLDAALDRVPHDDEILSTLADHAQDRLGFARAAVLVRDEDGWRFVRSDGRFAHIEDVETDPLVTRAWSTGSPELVQALEGRVLARVLPNAHNVVIAPVSVDDEPVGVVLAECGQGHGARIPTTTVRSLTRSATHAALSLRNARLLADVERLATRDALTGLANRRLFDETLAREFARAERGDRPLALVVLDIDFFKGVNDGHGHQIGDAVLRDIATAIESRTKASDLSARYGGDELVVLLPDCTLDNAVVVAERLRAAAAEAAPLRVTVSAGVAAFPTNALHGEALIAAADAALYVAKANGRNQTVAAT